MLSVTYEPVHSAGHLRPVNLRTDLGPLADLIELVFADSMDANGRAAIREMRTMSKLGVGLHVLSRVSNVILGGSLGYVWIEDGRLVGNVSVYPANWPAGLGPAWIIANVGVHPDYRRRGIARRLMNASMDLIRERKGRHAVLQVDANNTAAQRLYEQLGFVTERGWTQWRRGSLSALPERRARHDVHITRRRGREWREEYRLAQRVRPPERGGLGWLEPLHERHFRTSLLGRILGGFGLRSQERLVIRDETGELAAALWIETGFASNTRLKLMTLPRVQGLYDDALLHTAIRRYGHTVMRIDHPMDEHVTNDLLAAYGFRRLRSLVNMRWDVC